MSFQDLPPDWAERPLWDNDLADVVDLVVGFRDRCGDSLCLLFTDEDGAPTPMPINVGGTNWTEVPGPGGVLDQALDQMAGLGSRVLVTFAHREPGVTAADLRWRTALEDLLTRHGLEPIGFFTADLQAVTAVPRAAAFVTS